MAKRTTSESQNSSIQSEGQMDAPVLGLTPEDIVIAVMGITGSGKSTFISELVEEEVGIGHELTSCTAEIGIYSFIYKHTKRVFLIDTPGFDDTNRSDTDVLKDVAFFLSHMYKQKIQLAGIIYLHRITDVRMAGSTLRNITMFKKLCGENAYRHVVLATTMWKNLNGPNLSFDTGVQREKELLTNNDWWGLMSQRGSEVVRHTGDRESALSIIAHVIHLQSRVVLDIQTEMVDQNRSLQDTAAGKEVEKELLQAKERHSKDIQDLQEGYQQALQDRDEQLAELLQTQKRDLEEKIKRADKAQQDLKIDLERLSKEKTEEYNSLYTQFLEAQQKNAASIAKREAEYHRLKEEGERERREHQNAQQQLNQERAEYESRIENMISHNKESEAERARAEQYRLQRYQADVEAKFQAAQAQSVHKEHELQVQMQQLQQQQVNRSKNFTSSVTPWVSSLAGLATLATGVVTLNPGLIAMGVPMLGGASSGLSSLFESLMS